MPPLPFPVPTGVRAALLHLVISSVFSVFSQSLNAENDCTKVQYYGPCSFFSLCLSINSSDTSIKLSCIKVLLHHSKYSQQ